MMTSIISLSTSISLADLPGTIKQAIFLNKIQWDVSPACYLIFGDSHLVECNTLQSFDDAALLILGQIGEVLYLAERQIGVESDGKTLLPSYRVITELSPSFIDYMADDITVDDDGNAVASRPESARDVYGMSGWPTRF